MIVAILLAAQKQQVTVTIYITQHPNKRHTMYQCYTRYNIGASVNQWFINPLLYLWDLCQTSTSLHVHLANWF